jgi:hypothetical protein
LKPLFINMLFKKKGKMSQEDENVPSTHTPMDDKTATCTGPASEEDMPTDKSKAKAKELNIHADIVYPSGLKLALLMMSIFVSMFLISLVR